MSTITITYQFSFKFSYNCGISYFLYSSAFCIFATCTELLVVELSEYSRI